MASQRVVPLAPLELDTDQQRFVAKFSDRKGRYPNIFGVLCRNLPLLEAWSGFGIYTMNGSRLDAQAREVLVLRVARNTACAYERHHHERIGSTVGLSSETMAAAAGAGAPQEPNHQLMVRCADELADPGRLSDETWAALVEAVGLEATLDAIFTVGAYTALAMALNSCDVQVEASPDRA